MSNSMLHAFFIGRALAAAVGEQVEHLVSDGLSQLGKFDAEQRENLRRFTEEVMARAEQEEVSVRANQPAETVSSKVAMAPTEDLQATIDNLRAEIAQVRASLQQYRSPS